MAGIIGLQLNDRAVGLNSVVLQFIHFFNGVKFVYCVFDVILGFEQLDNQFVPCLQRYRSVPYL